MIQLKLILKCYNCRDPLLAAMYVLCKMSLRRHFDTPKRKYLGLTGTKVNNNMETAKKKGRNYLLIYKKKVTLQKKST